MSLNELKLKKLNQEISREEYWKNLQNHVSQLSELSSIFSENVHSISITRDGLILNYLSNQNIPVKLNLDPTDIRSAGMTILAEGDYEGFQEKLTVRLAQCSNAFLDVGANAGIYSLSSALSSPNLKVHSFEPNHKIFEILISNVKLNECEESISVHNYGLSNIDSIENLFVPAFTGSGGGSIKNLHPEEGDPEIVEIELRPLDKLNFGSYDLMKIDVEGHELSVIDGAINSIERNKPTIVIELLRKWMREFGTHPQDVINKLTPMGYRCFAILESALSEIDVIDDQTMANNFIFCHDDQPQHLAILISNLES